MLLGFWSTGFVLTLTVSLSFLILVVCWHRNTVEKTIKIHTFELFSNQPLLFTLIHSPISGDWFLWHPRPPYSPPSPHTSWYAGSLVTILIIHDFLSSSSLTFASTPFFSHGTDDPGTGIRVKSKFDIFIQLAREACGPEGPARWERLGCYWQTELPQVGGGKTFWAVSRIFLRKQL